MTSKQITKTPEATLIEFDYSSIIGKHTIRTKGITLSGRGITQHHAEGKGKPYNVYSLTQAAFKNVSKDYPDMRLAN